MENLLPPFQCIESGAPPRLLSHLHWSVGATQDVAKQPFESGQSSSLLLAEGSILSSAASVPPPPAPRTSPRPRFLSKAVGKPKGGSYRSRDLDGPSPLSFENRGSIAPHPESHVPHLPQLVKVPLHKPVYMSLFNGLDNKTFDVFFSVGRHVHHTLLRSMSTELRLVCGKKPDDPDLEEAEDIKMSSGFSVSTVSESTLKVDRSTKDGRVYKVDFAPDALGLDLGFDKEREEVVVRTIKPGGQAERIGRIAVGDRVISINDVILRTMADVHRMHDTRDITTGMTMEFLRPPAYDDRSDFGSKNHLLTIWRTTVATADKGRRLELDEDDCAIAPRTILGFHAEAELSPLAGHLAHLLASSVDDTLGVTLQFCNRTEASILVVYWIDYTGIRRYRNTLRPGQMYLERSYASHPWLIRAIPTPKAEEQQDKAKDGKRKVQQEGETSTPSNHALLIRLGPDAASSGQTFTTVWEPGRSNLSIMPFPRTDSGHYIPPSSAGGAAAHRPLHHSAGHLTEHEMDARVRLMRAELVQSLRNTRKDDLAGQGGGGGLGGSSEGADGARPWEKGLPHASVVVVDRNSRILQALGRVRAQQKQHGGGGKRGLSASAPVVGAGRHDHSR